ncbi:MAG: 23S rRNA (adenine(2503)-C(2))-methyltransferase RlmN [Bryobacterales bacterium]|nr:23S rRNA (adenine(2503)-C(2))-methyltransferase RlmN [Bryobacteraceae bacterium]MDW8128925.1 23S rRNA (adenine(2503)-C(2))-methyltransferase RlmN [Bryobacterales bacterium]
MGVLLGLDAGELAALLGQGHPGFRAQQLYEALYRTRVTSLDEVTTLPSDLRRQLAADHRIGLPRVERRYDSADGTRRYLLRLDDGRAIEAVFMPEVSRSTFCISTQVGCPVGCHFCMTAALGLERNLTAGEIAGQVLFLLREHGLEPGRDRVNVVMMGQGEPLLNLEAVLKATRLLVDPRGVGISPRRVTLSTVGIVPKIRELGQAAIRPKLAISLHATTDEVRARLIPIARRYPLAELLEACRAYPLRSWERLTFEYLLIRGVNDSDHDARRLASLLGQLRAKVNLIPLNPGPGIPYQPPDPERILAFQARVRRVLPCFIRKPRGQDVFAACGQLRRMALDEAAQACGAISTLARRSVNRTMPE